MKTAYAAPPASERSAPPTSEELGLIGDPIDETNLKENYSLRSANSKTYRNKDGMNLVAVYDNAVHYLKDDAWKNIDNTLSDAASVDGVAVLANKANNFSVKFAKTTKANFIGMLQKGSYSIKWSLQGAKESPVSKSVSEEVQPERAWDLTNIRSSVRYADIMPSTDLEYVVEGSEVKENLILNQPGLPESYTFLYQLSNLTARQDGNIIRFFDTRDSEKEVFALEAPFVYDAKDESTDAQFALKDLGNGKVEVKVSVDPAWLSAPERVYPVVIDPPLRTSPVTSEIVDAHVSRLAPDNNFTGTSYLSIGSSSTPGSLCRVYLKFNLPTLDPSDVVVDAKLNLFSRSYEGTGESEVQLHKVTSPWDDKTITWNNVPSHSSIIGEYDRFSTAKENLSFDVTGMVREWYNYGQNNGVMIKNADETGKFGTFYSGATSEPETNVTRPYINFTYVNNDGLESQWDYQSASAGRAGTAHVNYFTGAMTYIHPDIEMTGNRLPASISHVFGNTKATDAKYGLGWRLNYSQTIKEMDFGGTKYYRYFDEDGTAHYFLQDVTTGKWLEENDDGWELKIDPSSTEARFTLEDKGGNTLIFRYDTVHGILRRIRDTNNNELVIDTGTNAEITKITDGAGRITTLSYTNGRLTGITDPAGRTTSYAYTSDRLTKITYPDGKVSLYTYDPASGYLTSVRSIDNYGLDFAYTTTWPYKTAKVTERGTDASFGTSISLAYGLNFTRVTDVTGLSNTYQFDHSGKTIAVRDADGSSAFYGYDSPGQRNSNKLTLSSKLQKTVLNLVKNPGMERTTDWYTTAVGTSVGTVINDTAFKYMGSTSKKIAKTNTDSLHQMTQSLTLEPGKTYTLSAWMKRQSVLPATTAGAYLRFQYTKSDGTSGFLYSPYLTGSAEWERIELSFTLPSNAASSTVYVGAGIRNTTGTIWVDNVQLEEGTLANRYNLIENGDFTYKGLAWSSWYDNSTDAAVIPTTDPAHPASLSANVYPIAGDSSLNKAIVQNVKVSGTAGDRFVFAGWGRANSLPVEAYRHFSLSVGINYTNGTTGWKTLHFNEETQDWQYAAGEAVANAPYSSVDVFLLYYKNLNTAYFDGIQLYRESFGDTSVYDDNGNRITATNPSGSETNYQYNAKDDLIQVTDPLGNSVTAGYDEDRNPDVLTSAQGETIDFTYDGFGNVTKTKIGTTPFIETSATYTTSGNFTKTMVDPLSNVLTYNYDEARGILNSLIDANGKITNYAYDEKTDQMTGILKSVGGQTIQVGYSYTNDQLSGISHNGFSYSFTKDAFGRDTGVKVGSQSLVNYQYDQKGNITDTIFGNGHKNQVEYDSQNQVNAYKVWNSTTGAYETKFRYEYDAAGNVGYEYDVASGIGYRYFYDAANQLAKQTGTDGSLLSLGYDAKSQTQEIREELNGVSYTTGLSYDKDGKTTALITGKTSASVDNRGKRTYVYDKLGRLEQTTLTPNPGSAPSTTIVTSYTYKANPNTGSSSNLVETVTENGVVTSYTYDKNNNIKTIDQGGKKVTYTYNELSELIREDNQVLNKTITYSYDAGGNILEKKEYAYTTGSVGPVTKTVPYTYADANWKDKLTSFDGKAITYDAIGNPLSYDGWTYTWEEGRQLKGMTKGTTALSFKYNSSGLRTEKMVNGIATKYTYLNGKVAFETKGAETIHYSYDDKGSPFSMTTGGNEYFYTINNQGDVTGLASSAGATVVSYSYDSWGKLISTTGSMATTLGVNNPYRYRGYRYDTETGLYYLQSRYYNPEIGRFLNADDAQILLLQNGEVNLFAYCSNNPVNNSDSTGYSPFYTHLIRLMTIFSSVVSLFTAHLAVRAYWRWLIPWLYAHTKIAIVLGQWILAASFLVTTLWIIGQLGSVREFYYSLKYDAKYAFNPSHGRWSPHN